MDINKLKDLDEDESSLGEEIKPAGTEEEENNNTVSSPKMRGKFKFKNKKLIIIIASGFILVALFFVLKGVFFKKGPRIRQANFSFLKKKSLKQTSFPIPVKPAKTKPKLSGAKPAKAKNFKTAGVFKVQKSNLIKSQNTGSISKTVNKMPVRVPALPPMPLKSIKQMMKFNSRINELGEKVKIARLEQEIKSLNQTGAGGINNTTSSNISLVAVTKNTAIIAFGKNDVSMTVGMKYAGYECLMINAKGVALEKNNRVINLSLSM
jgi:hypothetical protein